MDFSKRQADPRRHLVGITFVILFHAFIVYALVTGLAKKVVEVVRAPIETKVIEEIKKPPPPPEIVVPPPPRLEAPPPPFIPPPEVQIATPPPVQPTITAVPTPPPPAPVVIAPTPPPVVAEVAPPPPPPPAAPKPTNIAALAGALVFADDANAVAREARVRSAQRLDVFDFSGGAERELDQCLALFQTQALRVARKTRLAHHRRVV